MLNKILIEKEEGYEELIAGHIINHIRRKVNMRVGGIENRKDCVQTCLISCLNILHKFDINRNTSLLTFLNNSINWDINKFIGKIRNYSEFKPEITRDYDYNSFNEKLSVIKDSLSDKNYYIFYSHVMNKLTFTEIGETLGMKESSTRKRYKKSIETLKNIKELLF